ncbi:ARMT1-like domain-containing protein [Caldivirga maquilingensis]|uniref:Damage-control phosphatase ARMT1-like metal-binding domain-containing protein n=1 Tax=Caldivirga maquilingensis (strain ATCC 700844 / DSM 13496 / JCM 10307 / IC-167) TaxID=397948 RepID=A8MAR2_CALMQ|nr:ARMT1-like domain-containing protein [Caldivirga maquilingensis]ABW01098.1 protein of unknown function DUF89 [Caldivirga maquilingensis IC-167]
MQYIDYAECTLCALTSRLSELKKFNRSDPESVRRIIVRIANDLPLGRSRTFANSFEELSSIVGSEDPYVSEKDRYEKIAREVIVPRIINASEVELIKVAAAANSVDVPMFNYTFNEDMLIRSINEEPIWLGINEDELSNIMRSAREVTYVVDNAGEFAVDSVLISKLATHSRVTVVTRLKPYETDVTYDYVRGMIKDSNVNIVNTGNRYPAFLSDAIYDNYIKKSDLVISKGVGNFEAYLESGIRHPNSLFLLKVKCKPLQRMLNVEFNKPIILHSRYLNSGH